MIKKTIFAVFTAVFVLGLAAAPAHAMSIVVSVPASIEWVDSGIDVSIGDLINLETHGLAITGPLDEYPEAKSFSEGQITTCVDGAVPGMVCVLNGAPFGALIGKIGSDVFLIGSAGSFTASSIGRLYLTVNDFSGTYSDNLGRFTVVFKDL
jgi:hypothetical protein